MINIVNKRPSVVKSNQPRNVVSRDIAIKAILSNKSFTIAKTNSPVVTVNTKIGGIMDITRIIQNEVPSPSTDGAQTLFTLVNGYESGLLDIFVDGIKGTKDVDYTETDPVAGTFSMVVAPASDEALTANYIRRV